MDSTSIETSEDCYYAGTLGLLESIAPPEKSDISERLFGRFRID